MRLPVRLKTRLDTRLPVRMGTKIETRYFRRNEGTTDYVAIPAVTLSGDQRFEFDLLTTIFTGITGVGVVIGGTRSANRWYAAINQGKPLIGNGTDMVAGTLTVNDGVFHHWVFEVVSDILTVTVDNVVQYSGVVKATLPKSIVSIMAEVQVNGSREYNTSGILANLKIYDNGTLIRDYPLDERKGTSVIYDNVGGNNGTIINGNDEDKGLFKKLPNGDWKGSNLDVPPWDSVDQILEVV